MSSESWMVDKEKKKLPANTIEMSLLTSQLHNLKLSFDF